VDFHEGFGPPPEPEQIETWALAQGQGAADHAEDEDERERGEEEPDGAEGASAAGKSAAGRTAAARKAAAAKRTAAAKEAAAREAAVKEAAEEVADENADVRLVLENGIREIVGDVRNSLDFHRSQDGGGDVSSVVLSGPALAMPGFAEMLESDLGLSVRRQSINFDAGPLGGLSPHHLTIAAGLAAEEVHP